MIDAITFPLDEASRAAVNDELKRMNHVNSVLVADLSQFGQVQHETQMLECYFEAMVEMGLIDADQLSVIRLTWEQRFNAQLRETTKQVKEQVAQAQRLAQLGAQSKKPGLIVPGR